MTDVKCPNNDDLGSIIEDVIKGANANFVESLDLAVNLLIKKKGATTVKTYAVLPHSVKESLKVAVFTDDASVAEDALSAGADLVGCDDMLEGILSGGPLPFEVIVTSSNMMGRLSKAAKILGPKGLMPNVKLGTLTDKIGPAVREIKAGRVYIKSDDHGTVHVKVGNVSMSTVDIIDNLKSVLGALYASTDNVRVKSAFISSTMGKGYAVNVSSIMVKRN